MHPNEQLIHQFYNSFKRLDWQGMSACYHPNIEFSDPVFGALKGREVSAMWQMLCAGAVNFELQFSQVQADDTQGRARWEASYTFSKTGRRVKNIIFAEFRFVDGKISRHSDHFSFWRWSSMALGPAGVFLGWSGYLRRKAQQHALSALKLFMRRNQLKLKA